MLLASTTKTSNSNIIQHTNQTLLPFGNKVNNVLNADYYKNASTSAQTTNNSDLPDFVSEKYEVDQVIGQGGFGIVYSAFRLEDNLKVAIKVMRKNKIKSKSLLFDELRMSYVPKEAYLLKRINHPNFIKLYDLLEDRDSFYMITEVFGKQWNLNKENNCMDLFECMENIKLTNNQIKHIFKQIMSSLMYLKNSNLYHSDIKDENILIDENLNIKIIDFGSCQLASEGALVDTFKGTIDYASPEILLNRKYCPELADVWSLGYLLHVMIYAKQPFNKTDDMFTKKYKASKSCNKSNECRDLLTRMLCLDDRKRATFKQIIQHPWLN